MTGVELIAAERRRQVEGEGWTEAHDDAHDRGELIDAAGCYLGSADATRFGPNCVTFDGGYRPGEGTPRNWPWESSWWKPTGDPVRDLIKAGALIAAEIDRLQRAGAAAQETKP